MLVATFIDFDEKTIPDEITLLGTLAGLLLMATWPDAALPVPRPAPLLVPPLAYQPLLLTSTSNWPAWLDSKSGLLIGLAIFVASCLALLPATMTARRGWWNGVRYYFASIPREPGWWKMLVLAALGSIAIALTWRLDGPSWRGLLNSLVGLAVGAGSVWAVRIVGWFSLRQEAMGFGDVTLMAMIGAFVGWQASVMIFFGGPLLAVLIAVAQAITTGRRDLPYGPYLCAMTMIVIIKWPWFWQQFEPIFALGWLLPSVLLVCLALMLLLLLAWKKIESAMLARHKMNAPNHPKKSKRN
jgi:prepilin signal peptidase PulO-like enzyme (type II secretory pathway)